MGDILYENGEKKMAEQQWQHAVIFNAHLAEDAGVATAYTRLAYLAALRGEKETALQHADYADQIYVQRGLVRYHLRLGEWLANYQDNNEIGPLLDLARLED